MCRSNEAIEDSSWATPCSSLNFSNDQFFTAIYSANGAKHTSLANGLGDDGVRITGQKARDMIYRMFRAFSPLSI
jgi:hypothetical protein